LQINSCGKKKITMKNFKSKVLNVLLYLSLIWVLSALSFNTYMMYLHFSDQNEKIKFIVRKLDNQVDKIR
jgi:hypothetical protein